MLEAGWRTPDVPEPARWQAEASSAERIQHPIEKALQRALFHRIENAADISFT